MNRLRAEEAHRIASEINPVIQKFLDNIFKVIEQSAKSGRFHAYFTSEVKNASVIDPIVEELAGLGYIVESVSVKDINLVIKW